MFAREKVFYADKGCDDDDVNFPPASTIDARARDLNFILTAGANQLLSLEL